MGSGTGECFARRASERVLVDVLKVVRSNDPYQTRVNAEAILSNIKIDPNIWPYYTSAQQLEKRDALMIIIKQNT